MSNGDLQRFISDLQNDPDLQQQFAALRHDLDAAVQWANAKGYRFTRVEAEVWTSGELADDDLEDAAGGDWTNPPPGTGG
jgi:predicted ribosomally synthesized peptide with nif11-like leader